MSLEFSRQARPRTFSCRGVQYNRSAWTSVSTGHKVEPLCGKRYLSESVLSLFLFYGFLSLREAFQIWDLSIATGSFISAVRSYCRRKDVPSVCFSGHCSTSESHYNDTIALVENLKQYREYYRLGGNNVRTTAYSDNHALCRFLECKSYNEYYR